MSIFAALSLLRHVASPSFPWTGLLLSSLLKLQGGPERLCYSQQKLKIYKPVTVLH